ncbi:hypothetical protein COUCH_15395 [Couchioplanes caeruleus]|uniref:hypothetical protein n=1 Tax=Couchioplanes caeruleus TaxID=56438 RepID=UPI0020BF4D1B|nr:hypothetical protein [Couchioplanes caeruleus]UQU67567.1 hypothetical protein COUCH_15395 [Couchioplanes caeruleus]
MAVLVMNVHGFLSMTVAAVREDRRMREYGLNLELDVQAAAGTEVTDIVAGWFDEASAGALSEPRRALETDGPPPAAPQFVDPGSWNPAGAPVHLAGTLSVSGRRAKAFDGKAIAWLRDRLADDPERVELRFALFAGNEPDAPNVWYPSLYAHRPEDSPGWLRIGAYVAEKIFLDPMHGAEAQRLWLGVLREFAHRLNPGFGQVEYGFDTSGKTALEWSFPPAIPLEERDPEYTVAQSRQHLRGYSWVTVVPEELANRLGGVAALEGSGAFVEVTALRNGGVWLLATPDYRDYGPEQVERVFQVLAPVLRPGRPELRDYVLGDPPPRRVVLQDAAVASGRATS